MYNGKVISVHGYYENITHGPFFGNDNQNFILSQ